MLLLAGYVECILLALWDAVDGLILPPLPALVRFVAFFGPPFFGFLILLWAAASPRSPRKWGIVAAAGVIGIGILAFVPGVLFGYGISRFVQRPDLNAFVADARRYGRITSMREDEDRPWTLNGIRVARTRAELDSLHRQWDGGDAMLLSDVLARDGIDPAVYEDARRRLRSFHFNLLRLDGPYVRLGRTRGLQLVYAAPGAPPPWASARPIGPATVAGARVGLWYN